jgi:diaminopimelate epimerase
MAQLPFMAEKSGAIQRGRPFIKMHGLRNDFIFVDARQTPYTPSREEVVRICDRREGVGADEVLIVEPAPDGTAAAGGHMFVRILNPDGREAEACGNATRCAGWLLLKESGLDQVTIATRGGLLKCRRAGPKQISVEMGRLRTHWRDIPLAEERDTLHLNIGSGPLQDAVGMNIGNPHAVFFVEDLDRVDMHTHGRKLQKHPLFPEDANIGAAQLMDAKTLKLSVWERPGALTTACGSGACAAVGAAHRRGLTREKRMTVIMPAGSLVIELGEDGTVEMTGPVEVCYVGYLPVIGSS